MKLGEDPNLEVCFAVFRKFRRPTFEMSGTTAPTTRRNVPQGLNLQQAAVRASDLTRGLMWFSSRGAGSLSSESVSSLPDGTWFYLIMKFLKSHFYMCPHVSCNRVNLPRANHLLLNFAHRYRFFHMECHPVRHITLREVNRTECPIFENRGEFWIAASWK